VRHGSDRHLVRGADERGDAGVVGQEAPGAVASAVPGGGAVAHVEGPAARVHRGTQPADAVDRGGQVRDSRQHADLAVPVPRQVLAQLPSALLVVDEDAVDAEVGVSDGDGPASGREERPHSLPQPRPVVLVPQLAPGDDDDAGAVRVQEGEVLELTVDVPARVADGHEHAMPGGDRLDAVDDLGEVRVADVTGEHADGGEVAAEQGAGVRVGHVVQLAGGLLHAGAQLGPHRVVAARQDPRRGGHGDTGPACHVTEVDRHDEKDRDPVGGSPARGRRTASTSP
jgi:hypothetical protein